MLAVIEWADTTGASRTDVAACRRLPAAKLPIPPIPIGFLTRRNGPVYATVGEKANHRNCVEYEPDTPQCFPARTGKSWV